MCGITGYVGRFSPDLIDKMTERIAHRGPDGFGYFRAEGAALGHRRLSIIDVAGGAQPIENEDGSLVVVLNGEIYNYQELRSECLARGHRLKTVSDTEVILHLYEDHGERAIEKLFGMFAFALWDKKKRRMWVGRDRFGVKPVYYATGKDWCAFGSEWKSLAVIPQLTQTLNPRAVHDYLAFRYVPGPGGLFDEMRKLPAGHSAIIEQSGKITLQKYWEPPVYDGPWERTDDDYLEEFAELFERSIRRRLMSEVPLGAYLSGGLDSGTIVAAMAKEMGRPVRTFSVGFDFEFDELEGAALTAKHTGAIHTEVKCAPRDIAHLEKILWHLDEPVGDPIIIPMYLLSQAAKKDLTVILAGEGADETLGGYLFHKALLKGTRIANVVPAWARRTLLKWAIAATPARILDKAFQYPARLGKRGKEKIVDFMALLGPENFCGGWRHLVSLFDNRDVAGLYTDEFRRSIATRPAPVELRENAPKTPLNAIIDLQWAHWLPDDILTKQDKLAMANGIEGREPFLDHELVEFALRLPPHLKISGGTTKVILRRYAERLLPTAVTQRKKMPFYAPMERFLKEPAFQAMIDDTLSDKVVRDRGIFRPEAVRALRASLAGGGDFLYAKQIFSLVALELWFRLAVDRRFVR